MNDVPPTASTKVHEALCHDRQRRGIGNHPKAERVESGRSALDLRDDAVAVVPDGTRQVERRRQGVDVGTETDTLHDAAHDDPAALTSAVIPHAWSHGSFQSDGFGWLTGLNGVREQVLGPAIRPAGKHLTVAIYDCRTPGARE